MGEGGRWSASERAGTAPYEPALPPLLPLRSWKAQFATKNPHTLDPQPRQVWHSAHTTPPRSLVCVGREGDRAPPRGQAPLLRSQPCHHSYHSALGRHNLQQKIRTPSIPSRAKFGTAHTPLHLGAWCVGEGGRWSASERAGTAPYEPALPPLLPLRSWKAQFATKNPHTLDPQPRQVWHSAHTTPPRSLVCVGREGDRAPPRGQAPLLRSQPCHHSYHSALGRHNLQQT